MKNSFRNTFRGSNSLDHSVGPDLGRNCLQKLTADNTSRQRVQINGIGGSSQQYFSHVETLPLNLWHIYLA